MPSCVCPDVLGVAADPIIYSWFSACVYVDVDYASFFIGLLSLVFSCVAAIPQMVDNYKQKSGAALSNLFLLQWLFGDMSNLIGCILTGQLVTQVLIGMLYVSCDVVIISQTVYYYLVYERAGARPPLLPATEASLYQSEPLLAPQRGSKSKQVLFSMLPLLGVLSLFGSSTYLSQQTFPISTTTSSSLQPPLLLPTAPSFDEVFQPSKHSRILSQHVPPSPSSPSTSLTLLHEKTTTTTTAHSSRTPPSPSPPLENICGDSHPAPWARTVGMLLGYASSALYLSARPPQILKNYQRKSVVGLSAAMFLLTIASNFTYGTSVLLVHHSYAYVKAALPWLLGSFGTMAFDVFILGQFWYYNKQQAQAYDLL